MYFNRVRDNIRKKIRNTFKLINRNIIYNKREYYNIKCILVIM